MWDILRLLLSPYADTPTNTEMIWHIKTPELELPITRPELGIQ